MTALWVIVVVQHLSSGEVFFGGGESGTAVEDLSAEDEIELGMSSDDVLGSHEGGNSQLLGVVDDLLGSLLAFELETTLVTLVFVQLVQEMSVGLSVLQVFGEVVDLLAVVGVGEMVVEPSEEQLIWGQLEQV